MQWLRTVWYTLCTSCRPVRGRTVRYAFSIPVLVIALMGAAVFTSQTESYVRMSPSKTTVNAGDRFKIDVYAFAHKPVNAVNISLAFPPNKVEVLGVDIGQSVITIWTQDPYVEGNKVIMRGGTYKRGFKGEHLIATVNVRAKQAGLAQFSAKDVKLLAGDGSGDPVTVGKSGEESVNLFVLDEYTDLDTLTAELGIEIVTDIDGDGDVSLRDVSVFMAAWADRSRIFDFNGDGRMTFRDFSIILADTFLR